jgi:hypothetical protein
LNLGENNFSGFIPQTISNMSSLKILSLYDNNFSGTSNFKFEYYV